jgi:hypothetical protein
VESRSIPVENLLDGRRPKGLQMSGMGGDGVMLGGFPTCKQCSDGVLLPLSDYGRDGAPIQYKAWVCSNPDCGFNVRIDNGEISLGRRFGQSVK